MGFIRALSHDRHLYEKMLHFFRFSAYKTTQLKHCWYKTIHKNAPFIRIGAAIGNRLLDWRKPRQRQFVLVKYGSVTSTLVSTDLELSPTLIIEAAKTQRFPWAYPDRSRIDLEIDIQG